MNRGLKMTTLGVLAMAIGALTPTSCAARGPSVSSLEDSLEPLRQFFNTNASRPRFVAIMSPT